MNKLYTAQEIADKLQIKKTTVYELIKRGELYSSKVGKQLRISEQQLKQYLERSGSGNNIPDQKAASSSTPDGNLQIPELPPESSLLKRDYLLLPFTSDFAIYSPCFKTTRHGEVFEGMGVRIYPK